MTFSEVFESQCRIFGPLTSIYISVYLLQMRLGSASSMGLASTWLIWASSQHGCLREVELPY